MLAQKAVWDQSPRAPACGLALNLPAVSNSGAGQARSARSYSTDLATEPLKCIFSFRKNLKT